MTEPGTHQKVVLDLKMAGREFRVVFPPNHSDLSDIEYAQEFLRLYKLKGYPHDKVKHGPR